MLIPNSYFIPPPPFPFGDKGRRSCSASPCIALPEGRAVHALCALSVWMALSSPADLYKITETGKMPHTYTASKCF